MVSLKASLDIAGAHAPSPHRPSLYFNHPSLPGHLVLDKKTSISLSSESKVDISGCAHLDGDLVCNGDEEGKVEVHIYISNPGPYLPDYDLPMSQQHQIR